MKTSKLLSAVLAGAFLFASVAEAGSIGRSGGGSRSSSSVSRSSSYSTPSRPSPSVAPAPSKSGGIGGTTASVGVRKSEVTNGVRNDVAVSKGSTSASGGNNSTPHTSPQYAPAPQYGYQQPPAPSVGGGFGSSFLGAMGGTLVGNALFGNHGHGGGTTVINNGTPAGGGNVVASGSGTVAGDAQFNPGGVTAQS